MSGVVFAIFNFGLPLLFLCAFGIYHCCSVRRRRRQETSRFTAAIARLDGVTYVRPQQQSSAEAAAAAAAEDGGDYDCAICLGAFEGGDLCSVMPGCRHEFHKACIAGWFKARNSTCPLCRAQLQWAAVGADDMV